MQKQIRQDEVRHGRDLLLDPNIKTLKLIPEVSSTPFENSVKGYVQCLMASLPTDNFPFMTLDSVLSPDPKPNAKPLGLKGYVVVAHRKEF